REIDVSEIHWGSPFGKMLTLPDGALLMNIYGGPVRAAGAAAHDPAQAAAEEHNYLYRSTDAGQTWRRFAHVGGPGFNETALLRLPDGVLLAAMRSAKDGDVWLTDSSNAGTTWSI